MSEGCMMKKMSVEELSNWSCCHTKRESHKWGRHSGLGQLRAVERHHLCCDSCELVEDVSSVCFTCLLLESKHKVYVTLAIL